MSLQVWLPLNGSLKNLGLDGSATIAGTPAWGTNGKIGNNYLSTSNVLTLTTNALKNTQIMSVSFWINLSDTAITSDWTRICQFSDGNSNLRIESCPSTSSTWRFLSVHNNGGYLMGGEGLISSDKNLLNKWTHVVYTYDNVYTHKAKAYINGVKTLDVTISGKTGKFTGSVTIENSNKFRINDYRIYSHALTETEVQEISKGLVAHYRLTGNGNPNYYKELSAKGELKNSYYSDIRGTIESSLWTDPNVKNGVSVQFDWYLKKPFNEAHQQTIYFCGNNGTTAVYPTVGTLTIPKNTISGHAEYKNVKSFTDYQSFTASNTFLRFGDSSTASQKWVSGYWPISMTVKNHKIELGSICTPYIPHHLHQTQNIHQWVIIL